MVSVSGDVAWGSGCVTTSVVTIPLGTIAYTWTLNAPFAQRWLYLEDWLDSAGVQLNPSGPVADTSATTYTKSGAPYPGAHSLCLRVWWGPGNGTPGTYTGTVTFTGAGTPAYCEYGTEANPDAQTFTIVTSALVDVVAFILGLGPLGILALDTLIGSPLFAYDCSTLPPPAPTITDADFIPGTQILAPGSWDKAWALFRVGVWFFYCRCKTGSPAPTPPPLPVLPPALTTGTQPAPVCDNEDLCTTLTSVQRQLTALQSQLAWTRSDVQLIQRQRVPFGYVTGTSHAGLFDQGYLAVQGILGLSVSCTTVPGYVGDELGAPDERRYLGYITFGTVDGFERRVTVTHVNQLILDVSGAMTQVGYAFVGGVVATVTELVREP